MKVMLATTPIRPVPTSFPPVGSLSILNYLREREVDCEFYHIDGLRPTFEDAVRHIVTARPDVLGISAVVSTAYTYTKRLVQEVKAALPDTLVIVGGSLAASAEVLLSRAGVDLCALGEGEKVFHHVIERARTTRRAADYADIPGLVLLDAEGQLVNTGYEVQLNKDELYEVRWADLEKACDISTYIYPAFMNSKVDFWFERDPRSYEPHRRDKNVASLPTAKGCVARCTFCHRWDKGIRYIPSSLIESRVRELIERYNVGFLNIVDENFGTDARWLREICAVLKPLDILWRVAGMRVNCITPEQIEMMKDAGCVAILYGMETGSARMLQVMDKKVKLEDNYNAMRWTVEAGLHTVVQLVLGMPGEDPATIAETTRFAAFANSISAKQRPWDLSINYAQSLPGTPLYEYARRVGLVDPSLDGEERYLEQVSDRDASDESSTLNFTTSPFYIHRSWRQAIQLRTANAYIAKFGKDSYARMLANDTRYFERRVSEETGYFNEPKREVERTLVSDSLHSVKRAEAADGAGLPSLWSLLRQRKIGLALICYPEVFRYFVWALPLLWLMVGLRSQGIGAMARETADYLRRLLGGKGDIPTRSLRKLVFEDMGPLPTDTPAMEPLRRGR